MAAADSGTDDEHLLEFLFKVIVVGDEGTGKTSTINRYVHNVFKNCKPTIGVDFALKVLELDSNTLVRLQLWDIAGQERYGKMTRVYYKAAVGAYVVFDLTKQSTFEACKVWKADIDDKVKQRDGSNIPVVLIANKCDLQQEMRFDIDAAKLDAFCQEYGFVGWFETSAKTNLNIDNAGKFLVRRILENETKINLPPSVADPGIVRVGAESEVNDRPASRCPCG